MTEQTITLRGTTSDCWYVSRASNDAARVQWQTSQDAWDAWFDVMEPQWVISYCQFAAREVCPAVPYQFVLRCSPIVC